MDGDGIEDDGLGSGWTEMARVGWAYSRELRCTGASGATCSSAQAAPAPTSRCRGVPRIGLGDRVKVTVCVVTGCVGSTGRQRGGGQQACTEKSTVTTEDEDRIALMGCGESSLTLYPVI
jgi:hypothetical protein